MGERKPIKVFGHARARGDDRPAIELQADDRGAIRCARGPRAELYGSLALGTSGILGAACLAAAASLLSCRVALRAWVVCSLRSLLRVPELVRSRPLRWDARGDVLSGASSLSAHPPCATVVGRGAGMVAQGVSKGTWVSRDTQDSDSALRRMSKGDRNRSLIY